MHVRQNRDMDPVPPKKTFRIGLVRGEQYKPIATIGISSDAGIFVVPVAVGDQGWRYGIARSGEAVLVSPSDHVTISERPKLHYHRSGIASVTLAGAELERRRLHLSPIENVSRGQVLSIVAIRPWALKSALGRRKGDLSVIEAKWPQEVAFSLSLLRFEGRVPPPPSEMDSLAPVGLIPGDDSRFTVDVSYFIPGMVLVGGTKVSHKPTFHLEPSITIAALPWDPERLESPTGVMGLWSESLRNPVVHQERDSGVLSTGAFTTLMQKGTVIAASPMEHTRRLFGP